MISCNFFLRMCLIVVEFYVKVKNVVIIKVIKNKINIIVLSRRNVFIIIVIFIMVNLSMVKKKM